MAAVDAAITARLGAFVNHERKGVPAHYHYDLRFMIEADPAEPLQISSESKDLAWVEVARVPELNREESMARMVRKTLAKS